MDTRLLAQLRSPDPAQRKQAIIAAGNARETGALAALDYLAQHDPVADLRRLAIKAARHITQQTPPSSAGAPAPVVPVAITIGQRHVNRAVDLALEGNSTEAAAELASALNSNPSLANDAHVQQLARTITGLATDAALARFGVGNFAAPPSGTFWHPAEPAPTGPIWTCSFCGTADIQGGTCPNCGASRPSSPQPAANAPTASSAVPPDGVFVLNPSNLSFVDGKVSTLPAQVHGLSAGCGVLFLIPFLLAGIIVIIFAVHEWQNYLELSRNGATITASVVNHFTSTDSEDGTTYTIEYGFKLDGRPYGGKQSVSWSQYNDNPIGSKITVIYSRSNPSISHWGTTADSSLAAFLSVFALVWNGIVLLVLMAMLNQYLLNSALRSKGTMLTGQLTACRGYTTSSSTRSGGSGVTIGAVSVGSKAGRYAPGRSYNIRADYSFVNPKGKTLKGTERMVRDDLSNAILPSPGTPVMVLYADDSTYKML